MKRIVIALMLALVLVIASGSLVFAADPNNSPAAENAPAKGHDGVPGKGVGHEKAKGVWHEIHHSGVSI